MRRKLLALSAAVLLLAACNAAPVSGEIDSKQYLYEPGYYYTTTNCVSGKGTMVCTPTQQWHPDWECWGLFIEYEDKIIRRCVSPTVYKQYEVGDYATDVRGTT